MIIKWSEPYGRSLKQNASVPFKLLNTNGVILDTFMTTELGWIKKKNDGRYEFFLKSRHMKSWKRPHPYMVAEQDTQGVCSTKEEAIAKVEGNYVGKS